MPAGTSKRCELPASISTSVSPSSFGPIRRVERSAGAGARSRTLCGRSASFTDTSRARPSRTYSSRVVDPGAREAISRIRLS